MNEFYSSPSLDEMKSEYSVDLSKEAKAVFAILTRNTIMAMSATPSEQQIIYDRAENELRENAELAQFIVDKLE